MAADPGVSTQEADISAVLLQLLPKQPGRFTGIARMIDRNPCLCQCNGLIKALAAQECIAVHGAFCLARAQKIVH